jgi:hypothetical protein
MVRGGGGVCWWASGRKQYITMEVISRKGIQYIQLYTAISREEFFQYMFILYYCICRYIYIPPPPTPSPPHLYFPHLLYTCRGWAGGGGWMWLIKTILLIYFA